MQLQSPIKRSNVRKHAHNSDRLRFVPRTFRKKSFATDHPQEMHRSSTGFPQRAGL